MAKLIPLGNNGGKNNRPSDEELNQMFGAFMDAFFGGISDEDLDEDSDDDIIPFDEFDDSDYWDDLYEGPTPFAYSVRPSSPKRRKARKKSSDRQVPNYAYKPKGKDPEGYYVEKIHSVIRWRVTSTNDVNYDLRVFEGWAAQAQKYVTKEDFYYAVCISRALFADVVLFHMLWHEVYPKQMVRVRKLERTIADVYYQCLLYAKDQELNWIDLCLELLQEKKDSYPFHTKGEGGFEIEDFIEKVVTLLSEEKANQYREAHPTEKQLLEKPIPVALPDKIEMPQGLDKGDQAPDITDFISEIPDSQYPSLIVSFHEIVEANKKKLKSFGVITAEEMKKMEAKYRDFILAYHRDGFDNFRKYYSYGLTRPIWNILHNYRFPTTNTAAKNKFLQQVVEPYIDLIWRKWDSPKLQAKIDEIKQKAASAQALKQERDDSLASMPSYLKGLSAGESLAFHEKALQILDKNKKKLTDSYILMKYDIDHRYQPLLKLLKKSQGLDDNLDEKVRQGVDAIFLSIYQALWKYMFYPYDLDYIIENKKVVRKVLDEIDSQQSLKD